MNNTFNILWYEDDEDWAESKKQLIIGELEKYSLNVNFSLHDGATVVDDSKKPWDGTEYDLILMDYGLSEGVTGTTLIQEIRRSQVLTDVLFYSSAFDEMCSESLRMYPPLDGVYYSERKGEIFTPKVSSIISKIVKRSETIVHLRGLVLEYASEFERRIEDLLKEYISLLNQEQLEKMEERVRETVGNKLDSYRMGFYDRHGNCVQYSSENCCKIISDKDYFSHKNRLSLLDHMHSRLLVDDERFAFTCQNCHKKFAEKYMKEFGQYRNAFGHAKATDKTITVNGVEMEINQDLFYKMRHVIREYDEYLCMLEKMISEIHS